MPPPFFVCRIRFLGLSFAGRGKILAPVCWVGLLFSGSSHGLQTCFQSLRWTISGQVQIGISADGGTMCTVVMPPAEAAFFNVTRCGQPFIASPKEVRPVAILAAAVLVTHRGQALAMGWFDFAVHKNQTFVESGFTASDPRRSPDILHYMFSIPPLLLPQICLNGHVSCMQAPADEFCLSCPRSCVSLHQT
jgi:hypothetical protein